MNFARARNRHSEATKSRVDCFAAEDKGIIPPRIARLGCSSSSPFLSFIILSALYSISIDCALGWNRLLSSLLDFLTPGLHRIRETFSRRKPATLQACAIPSRNSQHIHNGFLTNTGLHTSSWRRQAVICQTQSCSVDFRWLRDQPDRVAPFQPGHHRINRDLPSSTLSCESDGS
jgi:hypothetical protein